MVLKAQNLDNRIVYLSSASWNRCTVFTQDLRYAKEFKTVADVKDWLSDNKSNRVLETVHSLCAMSITEEELDIV